MDWKIYGKQNEAVNVESDSGFHHVEWNHNQSYVCLNFSSSSDDASEDKSFSSEKRNAHSHTLHETQDKSCRSLHDHSDAVLSEHGDEHSEEKKTLSDNEQSSDQDTHTPHDTDEEATEDLSATHSEDQDKGEQEDKEIAQLEREVLALCNGLRPLSIENASASQPFPNTVLILTKEALLNLHDIETLLRQNSTPDQSGQLSFAVEALLLNPKYSLLDRALAPVWMACLNTEQESQYMQLLIFIFARVLTPPNQTWKYKNNTSRIRWYMNSYTRLRPLFYKPFIWKGLSDTMHRLFIEKKNNDTPASQNEERSQLLAQKEQLLNSQEDDTLFSQKLTEINKALYDLDLIRLKRQGALETQLMCLKTLLLCVARLATPSDPQYALMISVHVAKYGLWDIFEADWRHLVSSDALPRRSRTTALTTSLWRVLDFYGRLLYEIPPGAFFSSSSSSVSQNSFVALGKSLSASHLSPHFPTSLSHRHTRFSPELMRQRLHQFRGEYTSLIQHDTLPRATSLRTRVLKKTESGGSTLYPDIYDLCLRPLGLRVSINHAVDGSSSLLDEKTKSLFIAHLDSFVRVGFNALTRAWIADCVAEDECLDDYDLYKLMNVMSWILHYERCWIQDQVERCPSCCEKKKEQETSQGFDTALLKNIVAHALSLRGILESDGILFVYKSFHTCLRKYRLSHRTDFLLKLCLRTLVEQLHFGLALTQERFSSCAEALTVVGRCVIEDIFRCNITHDILWLLRFINPSVHEPDLLYYVFETTLLLIHCFRKLGGSAPVSFGRGKRRFKPGSLSRITRRVDFTEFMEQLSDGRILKTMFKCLQGYRVHETRLNTCLAKLLTSILRDPQRPYAVGLCFQLSYFDLFLKILQDKSFRLKNEHLPLILIIRWVVEQFWSVFGRNKFVVLELLFSKSAKSPTVPFSYADGDVLHSVFTNYDEGLDHDYLEARTQQNNHRESLLEWRRQYEAQRRAEKNAWTPQESRQLVRLWEINKNLPHPLRVIRRSSKSKRPLREIRSHLIELGILEPEPDASSPHTHEDSNLLCLPLLRAVLSFCSSDFHCSLNRRCAAELTPRGSLLAHLYSQVSEVVETKRSQPNSYQNFPLRFDDTFPSNYLSDPDFCQILKDLGVVSCPDEVSQQPNDHFSSQQHWSILGTTPLSTLQHRAEQLRSYLNFSEDDLRCLISYGETHLCAITRLCEQLSKLNIITSIALMKRVEVVFNWQDTTDLHQDLVQVLHLYDQTRVNCMGAPSQIPQNLTSQHELLEYFVMKQPLTDMKCLALPEGISSSSVVQALAASLEHLLRKRKKYILYHASPIPVSEHLPLGQLVFPEQSLNTSFQPIVDFIKNTRHPLLAHLLHSLGFQMHNDSDFPTVWVLPWRRSLERIELDLHHLRIYAMSTFSLLTNALKRLATTTNKSPQHSASDSPLRECPILTVDHLDNETCHYMAKALYKLRRRCSEAHLTSQVIEEFQRIMTLVKQWNEKRPDNNSTLEDQDLFISVVSEEHEEHPKEGIGKFKDMFEFQHCLLAILGRCSTDSTPTEWFWSKGCSRKVIDTYLGHAQLCLNASLKILKKYATRKILFDEFKATYQQQDNDFVSPMAGSDVRADIAQYERFVSESKNSFSTPSPQMSQHVTHISDEPSWEHTENLEEHLENPLNNEEFLCELLQEASEDYAHLLESSQQEHESLLQQSVDLLNEPQHRAKLLRSDLLV